MSPAASTPRIDLSGATLLLHGDAQPGVDAVVVDLRSHSVAGTDIDGDVGLDGTEGRMADAAAHERPVAVLADQPNVARAALERSAALVLLTGEATSDDVVRAVVGAGAVAILCLDDLGSEPSSCAGEVRRLVSSGVDPSHLVVEVGPVADVVSRAAALGRALGDAGVRVGVCLAEDGPVGTEPRTASDATADPGSAGDLASAAGREIGLVTALLSADVATVRGVDPERFARVRAVLGSIDGAGAAAPQQRTGRTGSPGGLGVPA